MMLNKKQCTKNVTVTPNNSYDCNAVVTKKFKGTLLYVKCLFVCANVLFGSTKRQGASRRFISLKKFGIFKFIVISF